MSETFDYVIVGAGSAGCVLAHRLSADGGHRVLLLEAGGEDDRLWLQVPIGYGRAFFDATVNWMYRTEPQPSLGGRVGYWPRGKVLGGSSAINAMVFVRGMPGDFDRWAAMGNPGWSFDDVLPYFRRMEHVARAEDRWRGQGGPLAVADVSADVHPLCDAFVRAGSELGVPRNDGFNGATAEGVGPYEITVSRGRRMSTARAYLYPARGRTNLRVETGARALRVTFDGARATGVAYAQRGRVREAGATREVIVSAGAIDSPLLLQRSGIGPAELLRRLGLAVVHDAPAVGRHLQDHLCIDYLYRSRVSTLNQELGTWRGRLHAAWRYAVARRGPLALSVNQAGGFVRTRDGEPNLQLYFSPLSYTRVPPGRRPLMRPDPFPGFLLSAQPCRPRSRGRVELRSAEGDAAPFIVPNALADDDDLAQLVEGARFLRRLAAAPSLAAVVDEELQPGARVQSDDAIAADIRARASTVFHPVGTCRMGPDPREAVVDARLRAHGLAGLRVVDASVFPAITSGNTNAPTIMVAERAADLVLEDARGA